MTFASIRTLQENLFLVLIKTFVHIEQTIVSRFTILPPGLKSKEWKR